MSKTGFISVPFKTESGLSQIDGMAKFSSAGIVLEFESKLFGIIKDGVKEARIATDEVLDVKFRKGFLKYGTKIEIRLKDFTKLSKLPNKDGKITLKIKKDDFERAQEAVVKLQKDLTGQRELLPRHTRPSAVCLTKRKKTQEWIQINEIFASGFTG